MSAPMVNVYLLLFSLTFVCLIPFSIQFRKDIFSTKTAYRWIQDFDKPVPENDFMTTKFQNKHCVAVNSQIFLRHGARYPGYKDIRKMTELHRKLKLVVKSAKYPFLKKWKNKFPESEEKTLVDEGEEEQFALGSRFGRRLLRLFGGNVEKVKFISSSKERCIDSALAFYEGLTEIIFDEAKDDMEPEINDSILRFHTLCGKFIDAVENNKTHLKNFKKFKTSPEMLNVAESVQRRLGLEHATLDAGELKLLYFLCTFELVLFDRDDWCKLLTDEEREVIEYHNDMKQYWKKTYGHPVIGEMACPLVKSVFKALDKAVNSQLNNMNRRGDVAAFYFGHTESLAPFYAALGLYNESSPLLDTNFKEMKSRRFKSSYVLPFSANIAIILYKCDYVTQSEPSVNDYVLRYYVNERPEKIPVCNDYTCNYKDVRVAYSHHVDKCDFEKICRISTHDEL